MNQSIAINKPTDFLKLVGHELRWKILTALSWTDMHVQELCEQLDQPQNLLSYHLRRLRSLEIVHERRSIADGREIYYTLDVERVRALFVSSADALHPALNEDAPSLQELGQIGPQVQVLFLCTHNSARSQMAEGLLRARSAGHIAVLSAGTKPTHIHPLAIRAMNELGIDIQAQHSKSMEQFLDQKFEYIITVCDRAKESCPVFPGDPTRIHWSFPDPAAVEGCEAHRYRAFYDSAVQLNTRIGFLMLMIKRTFGTD